MTHYYTCYPIEDNTEPAIVLGLDSIHQLSFSLFIGYGNLQHATAESAGYHNMRYHDYFTPANLLKFDKINYSYGNLFAVSTGVVVAGRY